MVRTQAPARLYTADTLTNRDVVNTQGEKLGNLDSIVIDAQRGCVAYAVLTYATGFFNTNRKRFAVPWEALQIDEAHRDFVLDVDKQRLEQAPGFADDQWPSEPDESFAQDVHSYYGYDYEQGRERRGSQGYDEQRGYSEQQGGYSERERSQSVRQEQWRGNDEGRGGDTGYQGPERREYGTGRGYSGDERRGESAGLGSRRESERGATVVGGDEEPGGENRW